MKVLKKQGLTLFLIAALVVTLTLGIVFALPARNHTARAEEFAPQDTQKVSDEQTLLAAVENAGTTPTLITLDANIELQTSEVRIDRDQTIGIDLNGHTLSRAGYVLVNWWGNLYLQDSSDEKTGTIAAVTDDYCVALVYNYGKMVSSVNYEVKNSSCVAVRNQLRLGNDFEYICNPSLTIADGTLKQQAVAKETALIEVIDGDLTITGGTFITSSQDATTNLIEVQSTEIAPNVYPDDPVEEGGFIEGEDYTWEDVFQLLPPGEAKVKALIEALHLEAYGPYRRSKVTIENGDFTSFKSTCNVIKVAPTVREVADYREDSAGLGWKYNDVGPYDANVTIAGGKWGKDLSGFAPEGKWMELVTEDETGVLETPYYRVSNVAADLVGAEVEVNGRTYSFPNFLSAWEGAKAIPGDTHIVKLLRDESLVDTPISLKNVSGEMILDLNGHTLYLDVQKSGAKHFETSGSTSYLNTFVIRDSSAEAKGELVLDASTGIPTGNNTNINIYFCYTGSVANTKIVLESGTIRQKGLAPSAWKDYSTDNVNDETISTALTKMSLFQIVPSSYPGDKYQTEFLNLVTIKGGNILSELSFGTAGIIEATHPGVLFAYKGQFRQGKTLNEFGVVSKPGDLVTNKDKIFVLDLDDYLKDGTKVCKFSWDFSELVTDKGLTSNEGGDGYIVSKVSEGENFLVGSSSRKFSSLQEALGEATFDDTISVLQNATVSGTVEIGKGITLNLSPIANFELNFEAGVTLTGGATIKYGVVAGDITVDGDATLSGVHISGDVNVTSGTLTIESGVYEGTFTVNGGTLDITGGSFRGDQIETLDPYFGKFLGAYIAAGEYQPNELYEVKLAPNLKAQTWYKTNQEKQNVDISTPDEWNYFALYVNCGFDSFDKQTVKLTASSLDFSKTASGVSLFAARNEEINFLPAGTVTNPFKGHLDGGDGCVISGIVAREKFVGLIGYVGDVPEAQQVKISNITVTNSIFTVGNGYLDALNPNTNVGYLAGGAIVGDSHFGTQQSNIVLDNVTVDYAINGYNIYSGAVIGHTYGVVSVENLELTGSSVTGNWKTGGVVGMNESGSLTLKDAHISDVNIGEGSFLSGVVAGHTQGPSVTLEDCQVEAPGQSLVGAAGSNKQEITVTGPKTDIHVESLGTADTADKQSVKIELLSDGEGNSSQVQFSADGEKLPSNLTITRDGDEIVKDGEPQGGLKQDPENGSFIFEANPQKVDLYTGSAEASSHTGSYESFAAALAAAQPGDRIYLTNDIAEEVMIGSDKNVTINLGGYTLTGNIAVQGTLTLEHGKVMGSITVANNGSLTLVWAGTAEENKADLTIDNSTASSAAIVGEYTVKGSACARRTFAEDVVTKIELYEKHDAVYTANGNVITVTCEHCGLSGMITVEAEDFIYDGNDHEAEVTGVPEWLAEGVEIIYYQKGADGEYTELLAGLPNAKGFYKASITVGGETASVEFSVIMEVIVSEINLTDYAGEITYGDNKLTIKNFKLKDIYGNDVEFADGEDLTLTVTLKASKVGQTVAIITSLSFGGTTAGNYTLALAGQPAFLEVEVVPATLYASVDENGNWSFTGFVNGDDESVLSGTPELTRDGKVIGITSENYNIVYVGELDSAVKTDLTALWVVLAVVGAAAVVGTGLYFGTRRKKQ